MESVYQNTFWFIVALLAVLLPLYVLAVSLLGRAVSIARDQKMNAAAVEKQHAEELRVAAAADLEKGETEELLKRLKKAKKNATRASREGKRIEKRFALLRLWHCVGYPGLFLMSAAIMSVLAMALGDNGAASNAGSWMPIAFWIVALILTAAAIVRLMRALQVVQEVSLSSDEIALQRSVEALKTALLADEKRRRPEISILWQDMDLPIHVAPQEKFMIEYRITVTKGEVARTTIRTMYIHPSFDFAGSEESILQSEQHPSMPAYKTAEKRATNYLPGTDWRTSFRVTAAAEVGTYTFYARNCCEGFVGELEPFNVIVEVPAS